MARGGAIVRHDRIVLAETISWDKVMATTTVRGRYEHQDKPCAELGSVPRQLEIAPAYECSGLRVQGVHGSLPVGDGKVHLLVRNRCLDPQSIAPGQV